METKVPLITIFTATFNRASLLINLYQSLKNQTSHNIEWLIVDDGSTDNTEIVIEQIQKNNKNLFPIRYYQKTNGGHCHQRRNNKNKRRLIFHR